MNNDEYIKYLKEYTNRSISPTDKEKLLAWIAEDEELDSWLYEDMKHMSDTIDKDISSRILQNITEELKSTKRIGMKPHLRWLGWVAAAIALPIVASFLTYIFSKTDSSIAATNPVVINIMKGQKANIILPDSTLVWLNSASSLVYSNHYDELERVVELSGEAYFEVSENKKLPFIVKTPNFDIKVTGTSFNIKAYPEDDHDVVTLISGSINLMVNEDIYTLQPSQQIVYDKLTNTVVNEDTLNTEFFTLWRSNSLRYSNESMEHVARDIERIFNVKVSFDNESIKSFLFTGTITSTNLNSFLETLCTVAPIRYKISEDNIVFHDVPERMKYYERP